MEESPYPRPDAHQLPPQMPGSDKVMGILACVVYGLCFVCQGFGLAGQAVGGGAPKGAMQPSGTDMILLVISLLAAAAAIGSGIGLIQSRRWGFLLGVGSMLMMLAVNVFSIIRLPDQMKLAFEEAQRQNPSEAMPEGLSEGMMIGAYAVSAVVVLLNVGYMIYCIMRLNTKGATAPS
jgi:hypothetical protein